MIGRLDKSKTCRPTRPVDSSIDAMSAEIAPEGPTSALQIVSTRRYDSAADDRRREFAAQRRGSVAENSPRRWAGRARLDAERKRKKHEKKRGRKPMRLLGDPREETRIGTCATRASLRYLRRDEPRTDEIDKFRAISRAFRSEILEDACATSDAPGRKKENLEDDRGSTRVAPYNAAP